MTEQNTLDEQIDRALALIEMERIYPGAHSYKLVGIEAAKQQLKTLFTEHSKEVDRLFRGEAIPYRTFEGDDYVPIEWLQDKLAKLSKRNK